MSNNPLTAPGGSPRLRKGLLHLILCLTLAAAGAGTLAAQVNDPPQITLNVTDQPLARVIESLRVQSGYEFVFNSVDVGSQSNVTLTLNSVSLQTALERLLATTNLAWTIENRTVIIRKNSAAAQQNQTSGLMTGVVRDAAGSPMPGVNVIVKGTTRGVSTGADGRFSFVMSGNREGVALQFSFLGMRPQEIPWRGTPLDVVMYEQAESVKTVVITGKYELQGSTSVGATVSYTREDLQRFGGNNALQKLSLIDPSFNVVESLADGSNPNAIPEIRLRGQSGFPDLRGEYTTNPNQPLFILDGFETTLTKVMDMDVNRIESITILKDAAAKAIYGSKAGNGVVVIETHRLQAGELKLSYTGSLSMQAPDLSSYNLTNAAEKLQVEKAAGRFTHTNSTGDGQYLYDLNYNQLLEEALRGVDTYWLSKPVRTGIGHKHVLYLEGGSEQFTYGIDFSYNNVAGVMKGSDRNTISGAMTLSYRYKNITLRNSLDVVYNKGINSPYGEFSEYANMNPYYRAYDEDGGVQKIAGNGIVTGLVPNPLWNSTINTADFTEYSQISNNLYVEWRSDFGVKVTARGSISRTDNGNEVFLPASHTFFADYNTEELLNRRGRYTYGDGSDYKLTAELLVNYYRSFGKHGIFGNVSGDLSSGTVRNVNFIAEGFPSDYLDDITFARKYLDGSSPDGSESSTRDVGILASVNYSYDELYLFEGSIRMSGSSQFGHDNPWGTFWSLGVGWNVHRERFMKSVSFLDRLKIRGSIGFSGSQNFSSYVSQATYRFNPSTSYLGGYGAFLLGIENPGLRWQRKFDKNIGFDAELLDRKLMMRFDYYVANTDDLLTDVTIAPSTGFASYKENLGEILNKGIEARVSYRLWSDRQRNNFANLFITATHNRNTVKKISNSLAAYNEEQEEQYTNRPIVRYIEGKSLNVIWAVPSYGIDPASGRDILIKPDGTITYDWNSDYLAVCGDTEPKVKGTAGFNIDYEGFSLNVGMSWQFGGQIYNQTVVSKVENADIAHNVDRRVFSDRWYAAGDESWFKNIASTATTRATERFVENRNEWMLSSINFSYELNRILPVDRIGMSRLKFAFDMTDVARVSSVRVERGTSYPFARTFTFSLQANF